MDNGKFLCEVISLMDTSMARNDVSMSCSAMHHDYLVAYQKILRLFRSYCSVPDDLHNIVDNYCSMNIDYCHI